MQVQVIAGEDDLGAHFPFFSVGWDRCWIIAGSEQGFHWTTIVTSFCKRANTKVSGRSRLIALEGGRKMFWVLFSFLGHLSVRAYMRCLICRYLIVVTQALSSQMLFIFSFKIAWKLLNVWIWIYVRLKIGLHSCERVLGNSV